MFSRKTSWFMFRLHHQTSNYRRVCELRKVDIHQPKEWCFKGSRVLIHMIYIHPLLSKLSKGFCGDLNDVVVLTENILPKCLESLPKASFFQGLCQTSGGVSEKIQPLLNCCINTKIKINPLIQPNTECFPHFLD